MNLINEIQKDAMQFMRERRTLLLMLLAPLLVLFITGAIFGGSTSQAGKATIGICDLDQTNASQYFVAEIANQSTVKDYGTDAASLQNDVQQGNLAAGLIINPGFGQGIQDGVSQNITLMLDNSRFQVSPEIEAFVEAAVQKTDQSIGEQFIGSVWQQLDTANANLGGLLSDLNQTRQNATDMESQLQATQVSLNALNISAARDQITLANGTMQETMQALATAQDNLTQIQANFDNYSQTLNETEANLLQINDTLANASSIISNATDGINCSDPAFIAYCYSIYSINSSVSSSQQTVEMRLEQVQAAQAGLAQANATIQAFSADIVAAQAGSVGAGQDIGNMSLFVDQLQQNRDDALAMMSNVDGSLNDLVNQTYQLQGIIEQSQGQIAQVTSRQPSSIISPIIVSSQMLFGNLPFFDFMLPSLLPLILMFVALFLASTSLVREKQTGTLTRVYASQVNRFEFAAVKVLSYTIVLIPVAVLLALIASLFYGAFPVLDISTWYFVLQALVLLTLTFVAAGVLIAIYSDSEATAFLASLVIGLPLLFLSGLLFPFEFMPPIVAFFGMLSPLTQAVLGMQGAILYHSLQAVGSLTLVVYAAILTFLAGLSLKK